MALWAKVCFCLGLDLDLPLVCSSIHERNSPCDIGPRQDDISFWHRNIIFWYSTPWDIFIFVFQNLEFWPFEAHLRQFSSILLFIVCNSSVHATSIGISLTNGLTNLTFRTDGLYDTIMWDFKLFFKFAFLPLLGAVLFPKRA